MQAQVSPSSQTELSVSCVVPAYNEAPRIANVLDVLSTVAFLSEVIVVDDGSTDGTSDVVRPYCERDERFRLMVLPANQGKGGAIVAGAEASCNDIILFLDADLIGLRPEHVRALVEPVRQGLCCMTLGNYIPARYQPRWFYRANRYLTGQRCLRWSLFRSVPDLAMARWSCEIALDMYAWSHGYRIKHVPLEGLTHTVRFEKFGYAQTFAAYARMSGEVARYLAKHLPKAVVLRARRMRPWRARIQITRAT